ncbi:MAG: RusA family crossover junction endodeoxyribonuclease [Eubacteriales bacterium]|nr:RusA family crossover junction endodeoxyribonuclease [Eubacteriales bacterium]
MSISEAADAEGEVMKSIRFSIPGQPMGKQRPRVIHNGSFTRAYTPKETVAYENLVKVKFQEAAKGRRFADEDMLDVRIIVYYGIPKSTSKRKRKLMLEHKIRPGKKPDWDNVGKVICDSLNTVAYHDDSSIVDAQVRKFYSERPRVDVTIRRIDPGEI